MSTKACSLRYKYYNSGWSSFSTTLSGGYAGTNTSTGNYYAVMLEITTPNVANIKDTGISITLPIIRQYGQGTAASSGTLYITLHETLPNSGSYYPNDPSSSNYDVKNSWSTVDYEYHNITFGAITRARTASGGYSTIKANTKYYAYIGGTKQSGVPIMIRGGNGIGYSVNLSYTAWTAGSVSVPGITDDGKNKFKISCTATPGTNNKLSSLTIYYTSDGTTPTTSSSTIANNTYKTITSTKSSYVINAYAVAKFEENTDKKYSSASKTIYYHATGAAASAPTVVDKGNNKATISGKIGKSVTNNAIQSATLYYTTDGSDPRSSSTRKYFTSSTSAAGNLVTTFASEATYSKEIDIPEGCTVIKACLVSTFAWGKTDADKTQTSDVFTNEKIQYHSSITIPTNKLDRLNIIDNGDNTFDITGTDATSGDNNTATTTYQWGYSTSYGSSGKGTKILTIEDKTQATRTVYAKAVTKPSWIYDPNYNSGQGVVTTMSKDIKQYVVPSAPKDLKLNYTRARLTLEEPWTFTWTPSEAINSSSPLSGYFIMLRRLPKGSTEWEYIREINSSLTDDYISISHGSNSNENSNYFARRDNTSCTAIIQNPAEFGIKPGDKIKLRLKPFTFNGAGGAVQADGLTFEESAEYRVYETGVVDIKVDGEWTTGKVWVKQDDKWQKAKEIMVNVDGEWKYSQ